MKNLVMEYFQSWQYPTDYDTMEKCLTEDVNIDLGFIQFKDRAVFVDFLKRNDSVWTDVRLLYFLVSGTTAVLLYEGVQQEDGKKIRVAEFLEITEQGKIQRIVSLITEISSNPPNANAR